MFSYEYTLLQAQLAGILVQSYEPILLARNTFEKIVRRLLGAKKWCPESCVCRQAQKCW